MATAVESRTEQPNTAPAGGIAWPEGTRHPDVFAMLGAPFERTEVRSYSSSGKELLYVTARTVMNRLDNVVGPENWEDTYEPFGAGGVQCHLTLTLPDGRRVTKSGLAGQKEMKDESKEEMSGESGALKRAAVKFGVARYLYRDGVPWFVAERTTLEGPAVPLTEDAEHRIGYPPREDPVAPVRRPPDRGTAQADRPPGGNARANGGPPRTGKALFAWVKDREAEYEVNLLKYLNQWAKLQDFPGRMVDWDGEQVALAYAESSRKLATVGGREEALSNGH